MPTLTVSSMVPASAREVYAWHERPGAFERLIPPWVRLEVLHHDPGLTPGGRIMFLSHGRLSRFLWVIRRTHCEPGVRFVEEMDRGPLRAWSRERRFDDDAHGVCVMSDTVTFHLPGGRVAWATARRVLGSRLERTIAHQHARVNADLAMIREFDRLRESGSPLRIAVSGTGGFLGSALAGMLGAAGHSVVRLVRERPAPGDVIYQPGTPGSIDRDALNGVDVVIHLAGAPLMGGRWTASRRQAFRDSRVEGTRVIAQALASLPAPPKVMVVASGINIYGDRGEEELHEESGVGSGFFAELARDWEAASEPARRAHVRVVHLRLPVVLGARGGALRAMRTPFSLGLGMIPGAGSQWMPWVSLEDFLRVVLFVIARPDVDGPVNVVAPGLVRAVEFARTLAGVLERALLCRAPAFVIRALVGQRSEPLLASTRAVPRCLLRAGFRFAHPALDEALRWELGLLRPRGVRVEWR
jgi:uncharacterized protein (TIGR01777 family)